MLPVFGIILWKSDPSLFHFINESCIIGYIAIHVDDIIWAGTNFFNVNVIDKHRVKFKIGKENTVLFRFLSLDITSNNSTNIMLSQNHNIMQLSKSNLCNEESISSEGKTQSAIDKLLWISTQTRTDISFDVSPLSQCIKSTIDEN